MPLDTFMENVSAFFCCRRKAPKQRFKLPEDGFSGMIGADPSGKSVKVSRKERKHSKKRTRDISTDTSETELINIEANNKELKRNKNKTKKKDRKRSRDRAEDRERKKRSKETDSRRKEKERKGRKKSRHREIGAEEESRLRKSLRDKEEIRGKASDSLRKPSHSSSSKHKRKQKAKTESYTESSYQDEYKELQQNISDNDTEVTCMIDFYDKIHFNRILAKKMAAFLKEKRNRREGR